MGGKRRKRKGKVGREGGDPESVSRGEVSWVEESCLLLGNLGTDVLDGET